MGQGLHGNATTTEVARRAVQHGQEGLIALAKRPDVNQKTVAKPKTRSVAKASGYGRFGGKATTEEFTELRWIAIQTTPRQYPF